MMVSTYTRRAGTALVVALVALAAVLSVPAAAHAAVTGTFLAKFGSAGSGNAQFGYSATGTSVSYTKLGGGTVSYTLHGPMGLVYNRSVANQLIVADTLNNRIEVLDYTGTFVRAFGTSGTGNGQLSRPEGVTSNTTNGGRFYVVDTGNNRVQYFDTAGTYKGQWGSAGSGNGQFNNPRGITSPANTSSKTIYVADTGNNRIQYFDGSNGKYLGQWGTYGTGNGQFDRPVAVRTGLDGSVYVLDQGNHRIQRFSATGAYLGQFGTSGTGNGQYSSVSGFTIDDAGYIYTADSTLNRITQSGAFTASFAYAGEWGQTGSNDGEFSGITALSAPPTAGKIFALDSANSRIQVFAIGTAPVGKREYVSWDGLNCTACHYKEVRKEHAKRADSNCTSCHNVVASSGNPDFTVAISNSTLASLETQGTCGTGDNVCHGAGAVNNGTIHSGASTTWHGTDATIMQKAMGLRDSAGNPVYTSNSCAGTGGACHTYGSSESGFYFGTGGLSTAHNDYWKAQKQGRVNTALTNTVNIQNFSYGCGLCHAVANADPLGRTIKQQKLAAGQAWDCSACHNDTSTYTNTAGSQCYRTPYANSVNGATPAGFAVLSNGDAAPVSEPATLSAYIQALVDMVTGDDAGSTADTGLTALAVTASALPESAIPATKPESLATILAP